MISYDILKDEAGSHFHWSSTTHTVVHKRKVGSSFKTQTRSPYGWNCKTSLHFFKSRNGHNWASWKMPLGASFECQFSRKVGAQFATVHQYFSAKWCIMWHLKNCIPILNWIFGVFSLFPFASRLIIRHILLFSCVTNPELSSSFSWLAAVSGSSTADKVQLKWQTCNCAVEFRDLLGQKIFWYINDCLP